MSEQQKQEYLRTEILEKEYDPEEFVKFICEFGMDENEILNITLEQLTIIVNEFVQSRKPVQPASHKVDEEFGDFEDGQVLKPAPTIDIDWSFFEKKEEPKKLIVDTQLPNKAKQQPKKPVVNSQLLDLVMRENRPSPIKPEPAIASLLASDVYNQMFRNQQANLKIKCVRQLPNILDSLSNVKYTVEDHVVQGKSNTYMNKLFGSKQVIYGIKVEGRNKQNGVTSFSVTRKYSDFNWLKTCLAKRNPGLIIPPLPKEPDDTAASIISTKNKLHYFLEEVSKQPQLKSSKYFEIFLTYQDYSDFEAYCKNNESVQKPKSIVNVQNPLGQVECNFSQGLKAYSQLILDYSNKTSTDLKKVKEITKEISMLYYNISLKYTEISQVLTKIQGSTDEISNDSKNEFRPLKKLSRTYQYLAGLMTDHSTMVLKEKDKVNTFLKDYFSYQDNKIRQVKTIIDKRNQFSTLYQKRSAQQIKDVSPGVLSKFSSVLFGDKQETLETPSSNFKVFKNQYGYFNHQLLSQWLRLVDRQVSSYTQHFTNYANQQLQNIDQMQQYWSNVMVSLSRLNINALL